GVRGLDDPHEHEERDRRPETGEGAGAIGCRGGGHRPILTAFLRKCLEKRRPSAHPTEPGYPCYVSVLGELAWMPSRGEPSPILPAPRRLRELDPATAGAAYDLVRRIEAPPAPTREAAYGRHRHRDDGGA